MKSSAHSMPTLSSKKWETHTFDNVVATILRTEPEPDQSHPGQIRVYFSVAHRPGEELWCWQDAFLSRYVPSPE